MPRAALYARFSSDLQNERSADDQLAALRVVAEARGLEVVGEFADRGISGASLSNRPEAQRLLRAVDAGDVDVVIAEALDRLSRDQEDTAHIFKRLEYRGVQLETLSEGRIGELHVGLSSTMNRLFLVELGKKTRRGQVARVRAGFSGGGRCYGYRIRGKGEFEPDPEQAAVVRRIFEEYARGRSPRAIADRLNAEGVPGGRSGLWRANSILGDRRAGDGILCQELYIGVRVFNRRRFRKHPQTGRRSSVLNPPAEWIREQAPLLRIIDDALWSRAQARMKVLADAPGPRARRAKRLLSGLVGCALCGANMHLAGGKFVCSTRVAGGLAACANGKSIDARTVEGRVVAGIRDNLLSPEAVEAGVRAFHDELRSRARETAGQRAVLEKELAEISRRLERTREGWERGLYDAEEAEVRIRPLKARRDELQALLAEADAPPVLALHPHAAAQYRRLVAELTEGLDGDDADEAREAVRGLIDRVVFTPAEGMGAFELTVHSKTGALLFSGAPAGSEVMVGAGTGSGHYLGPRAVFAA